jgi:hypothetical protein
MNRLGGFNDPFADIKRESDTLKIEGPLIIGGEVEQVPLLTLPRVARWSGSLNSPGRTRNQLMMFGFVMNVTSPMKVTAVSLDSRTSDGRTTPCRCRFVNATTTTTLVDVQIPRTRVTKGLEFYQSITPVVLQPAYYFVCFDLYDNNNCLFEYDANMTRPRLNPLDPRISAMLGYPGGSNQIDFARSWENAIDTPFVESRSNYINGVYAFCGNIYVELPVRNSTLTCGQINVDNLVCKGLTNTGGLFLQTNSVTINAPGSLIGGGLGTLVIANVLPSDRYLAEVSVETTTAGGLTVSLVINGVLVRDLVLAAPNIVYTFSVEFHPPNAGTIGVVRIGATTGYITMSKFRVMKVF